MLELKNVYLAYNREYYALFDVNLTLNKGDHLAIIGETGSGKTALLRAISGLEKLNKGDIYIDSTNLNKIDFERDVSLGYISTKPVFFENKTVEKNLQWVLKQRNIDKVYWAGIINQVLEDYEISHLKKVRINTLCRSDKRLVQIARLALRPIDILLCDECEIERDFTTNEKLNNALRKLINSEKKDKIVIIAYAKESDCDMKIINKKIYMHLGNLEENQIEEK